MSVSLCSFFSLICLATVGVVGVETAEEECKSAKCRHSGPAIRFPFWLKGHQPNSCGYPHPNFQLSCSTTNNTELDFQYTSRTFDENIVLPEVQVKVQVLQIDYTFQRLYLSNVKSVCPAVNLSSAHPFMFEVQYSDNISLFNCSSVDILADIYAKWLPICSRAYGYQIVALHSYNDVWDFNLSTCAKLYDINDFPLSFFYRTLETGFEEMNSLKWVKPSCRACEAQEKYCRLKNNSRADETECFDIPKKPGNGDFGHSRKLPIAVVIGTLLLVLVISVVLYIIIRLKKKKEDQKKIEKFLDDYKALRPSRFSYADIKKITDNFKVKLGEGGYGTVYKGNLSDDILVAVKLLNNFKGNGEEFINEVCTLGTIHHINVVRLVGYCADGTRAALMYEFLPNDSLEKLLSSRKRINSLGWVKLQQIAISIAKGLDYLHQGCNQRILHFDIKPQNILLDQNFNPKVADFGLAKLCSKEQSAVSMTVARGTVGYIAPEVFSRNFGNVSYKSDVYSFGMLLLDMVGGRKRQGGEEDTSEMYFPEWMYKKLEKGEDLEIQIDKEEDCKILFKKLAIVGLWCIQWYPVDRPSMKIVIQMLEGENVPTMPPNPFIAAKSTTANAFVSGSNNVSNGEICNVSEIE